MFAVKRSILILSLLVSATSIAVSQPPKGQFAPLDREREEVAEKDIPKSSDTNLAYRLALSAEPDYVIHNAAELAAIEKVIKYYLYRLTWEEVQKDRDASRVGTVGTIMSDIIGTTENSPRLLPRTFVGPASDQDVAATRKRQLAYVQQVAPIMIKHAKLVMQNKQYIARINGARVLARLAEWGQEAAVDELINIINHPGEHDAVRLWAFRGLEEIFALNGTNDIRAKELFQSKDGALRFKTALFTVYDWLNANTKVPESRLQYLHPEEVEALRYVRRAAERALGASRRPLIVDERAAGKQEGPIAELLNRIVAGDAGITPAASPRERLDATIALCQLRTDFSPSYQPDYSAYQIGKFLTDLGAKANADLDNKGATAFAWPLEAQRLYVAIAGFAAQKTIQPVATYLQSFKGKADALLVFLDDFTKNTDAVKNLADWLQNNQPPNKEVFKPLPQK
ncbi:MAG TPA: hypothetical protein PLN21_03630 [Gemmatales bacterium]|nr:hypothetical protein [Gemmatales bacterium]